MTASNRRDPKLAPSRAPSRAPRRALTRALTVAVLCAGVLAACSDDDDGRADADPTTRPTTAPAATVAVTGTASASVATSAVAGTSSPPAPTTTLPVVPETGVPGLDSEDAFCAAWSRFGGSWQVLVQASASGPSERVARLEVIASSVVADAYDDVFAAWPEQLESEREVVADGYFGAFLRRSADARAALVGAGATDDELDRLAEVWTDALAAFDPGASEIQVAVPGELEPLVTEAAQTFAAQRAPLPADPSMVIVVSTPLTDAFLASACPDQGWIGGQEVVEP